MIDKISGWSSWVLSMGGMSKVECQMSNVKKATIRCDRPPGRRVRIRLREALGRRVPVVPDLAQGRDDRGEVRVPHPGGESVGVDEVDVAEDVADPPERQGDVALLDAHVEEVTEQADVFDPGDAEPVRCLRLAIEQVRLVP